MRTLKIFISSSIRFADLRNTIELHFAGKNKAFENKIFFKTVLCEDFDNYVSEEGSQELYNKAIDESDILLLFYSSRIGKYTLQEFERAFRSKVKIYIYKLPDNINNNQVADPDSVKAFKDRLNTLTGNNQYFDEQAMDVRDLLLQFQRRIDPYISDLIVTEQPVLPKVRLEYKINRENGISLFKNSLSKVGYKNRVIYVSYGKSSDKPSWFNYRLDEEVNKLKVLLEPNQKPVKIYTFNTGLSGSNLFLSFAQEIMRIIDPNFIFRNLGNTNEEIMDFMYGQLSRHDITHLMVPIRFDGNIEIDEGVINNFLYIIQNFTFSGSSHTDRFVHFLLSVDNKDSALIRKLKETCDFEVYDLQAITRPDLTEWAEMLDGDKSSEIEDRVMYHLNEDKLDFPLPIGSILKPLQETIKDLEQKII